MFGEDVGYMSSDPRELSEEMKAQIDKKVAQILKESEERVTRLLESKGSELRVLAKSLYWYDYLDAKEMDEIFKGKQIEKEKVREWNDIDGKEHPVSLGF